MIAGGLFLPRGRSYALLAFGCRSGVGARPDSGTDESDRSILGGWLPADAQWRSVVTFCLHCAAFDGLFLRLYSMFSSPFSCSSPLTRRLARCGLVVFVALVASAAAATRDYLARIDQLKIGMAETDIVQLLGAPAFKLALSEPQVGEAWYYRLSAFTGADQKKSPDKDDLLTAAGRLRCVMQNGQLTQIAGLWPTPVKPPHPTPKKAVMLVDTAKVYDGVAVTKAFNARIREQDRRATAEVEKMNAEGNKLVSEYARLVAKRKGGVSKAEEQPLNSEIDNLLKQIDARRAEIEKFIAETQLDFREQVSQQIDVCLPAISEAILLFQRERGYEFAFEKGSNVLSPANERLSVSGIDVTKEIIRWIDSGHAVRVGLTGDSVFPRLASD